MVVQRGKHAFNSLSRRYVPSGYCKSLVGIWSRSSYPWFCRFRPWEYQPQRSDGTLVMSWRLHFWTLLLLVEILTGPSHDSVAQTRTGSVTQVNLENYGWRPLPRVREWVGFGSQQVSIDHEGRILVGFTERENTSLATRNDPGLSFHILRFTSDGKVDLSLALPTNNLFNNGLYLGPEDQLFARANETFQVLSEENGTGTEVAAWRPLAPCTRECQISQSPSRRTLMVTKWEGHDEYTHILFDVSS